MCVESELVGLGCVKGVQAALLGLVKPNSG